MKWIKALSIGLQILGELETVLNEYENPSGKPVTLPPIYITKDGRRCEIEVSLRCDSRGNYDLGLG